jgi:hypothetical protein
MTTPAERQHEIDRLSLLCELDRARVRLHVRRVRHATPAAIPPVIGDILDIARLLPGRWGRWARRLSFATRLLQSVG